MGRNVLPKAIDLLCMFVYWYLHSIYSELYAMRLLLSKALFVVLIDILITFTFLSNKG